MRTRSFTEQSPPPPPLGSASGSPAVELLNTVKTSLKPDTKGKKASKHSFKSSSVIHLGNLPLSVDKQLLKQELDGFPGIEDANIWISSDNGVQTKFAFVRFQSPSQASDVIRLMAHDWQIEDRKVAVNYAKEKPRMDVMQRKEKANAVKKTDVDVPSSILFIGNIDFSADRDEIKEKFAEFEGFKGFHLVYQSEDVHRGYGFAYFQSTSYAQATLDSIRTLGLNLCGRPVRVEFAPEKGPTEVKVSSTLCFTMNMSRTTINEVLKGHMAHVKKINFAKNMERVYVDFDSSEHAREALEALDGRTLPDGQLISGYYAIKREQRSSAGKIAEQ